MDWERRKKMMIRFSIMSSILIALFWSAWHLIVGQVPVVTSIQITDSYIYMLQYDISRWWDIVLGPFYSSIFVLIFTSRVREIGYIEDLDVILNIGLFTGLIIGLFTGLSAGLFAGLVVGLLAGLFTGGNINTGLVVSLVVGLSAGLFASLSAGLFASLSAGLFTGLFIVLVAIIMNLLKVFVRLLISNKHIWKGVFNWLSVQKSTPSYS